MSNPPILAATVLLVRDVAAALEIFMVVRHQQIDFAGGAMVFPGGKVDAADMSSDVRSVVDGADSLGEQALGLRVAAIREAFEECGVLLARRHGSHALVSARDALELGERYRARLAHGELPLSEVAAREGIALACDLLVPFAHWITPEGMPKRFDTHFFLAAAPNEQLALHDGAESVDSAWVSPRVVLEDAASGRRTVVFPTRMNLERVASHRSVAAALDAAREAPVVTVLPVIDVEAGMLRIPADAGYSRSETNLADLLGMPSPFKPPQGES